MRCALIGEKLSHSYSRLIHKKFGMYSYDLVELPPDNLKEFVEHGGYDAFNVTIPYKSAIIPYIDKVETLAMQIGAINTVCRLGGKTYGYNTDILGMAYMLKRAGIALGGKHVMIFGSGGTGKTAEMLAKKNGAASITVVSRSGSVNYKNFYELQQTQIIINTTPVGMYPYSDISLADLSKFRNLEAVADVIYNPMRTRLMLQARELNLKYAGGLYMLVAQAKYSMDIFVKNRHPDEIIEQVYKYLLSRIINIVLVGMPGSGKTSIGKAVARRERRRYVDSDAEIVASEGRAITEIFAEKGEEYFRKKEKQTLFLLGSQNGMVISTGGGAVLDRENYYSLKANGRIYYLEREITDLATRGRPLSTGTEALKKLLEQREPLYKAFADVTVENDGDFFSCVDKILEDIASENFDN
ncbi:MAG TPA: shikimate dehydrogenase [Firmicutes bacterium]|nr:shikimate dehydrogenase [Bacillota bacterium]